MKKARVVNNMAVDVTSDDPASLFHPAVASEFVEVPDDVENGWIFDGMNWVAPPPLPAPAPLEPAPQSIPLIGPIAFQMLFTVPELVAIDAARDGVPAIRIFWKLLDDPRTDYVDRNLEPVKTMLHSLEAGGLLGEGRANEIIHATL